MNEHMFKDKSILIVGLAKSGEAAAKLLLSLGANVTINDLVAYEDNEQAQRLEKEGAQVICGHHPLSLLDEPFTYIVKNPGIPYTNPLIKEAVCRGFSVITEIELSSLISKAEMIAITGSNGKTTVTTLIYEMLQESARKPLLAGNIGIVSCEVANAATADNVLVVEVSSFQLEGTEQFKPNISVLLNIFSAHLDYHKTMDNYVQAKEMITKNQDEKDVLIYNADDPLVCEIAQKSKATTVPFSVKRFVHEGVYIQDETIYYKEMPIVHIDHIVLPGAHNLENIVAAIGAAIEAGANKERIQHVLKMFTGVAHRLQYVTQYKGRTFYNDSKATNILATSKALQSFTKPIVLLAGGLDRGNSFAELSKYMDNVHTLVTFGESKQKLADTAKKAGVKNIIYAKWMEDAVEKAFAQSNEGDIILLSPACASWDQYRTFEERGNRFIDAIEKLQQIEL